MTLSDLQGIHGVGPNELDPILNPYESLQEVMLPSAVTFTFGMENVGGQPTEVVKMKPDASGVREYYVDYEGYMKAMRLAGFSESVINKYPAEIMVNPLTYGFRNRVGEEVKAFVRNDRLVAFVKPSLQLISTRALVNKMFEVCGGEGTALFERLDHTLQYTNCSMIIPLTTRAWDDERLILNKEVEERWDSEHRRLNDVVVGGINFQNSIMGEKPLEVSSYVYRLTCSNGMISAESRFKWSRKTEATPLMEWFAERVQACRDGLDHEFDKIDHLRQIALPEGSRAEVLTNVFQEYDLSDRMRQGVLTRLTDAPPRHMWDVVNAITNVANDAEYIDNPHTIRRLQVIGGDMSTKLHICESCHSVSRH